MARLKTEKVRIENLRIYENNPRKNKKAVGAVVESITKFGMTNPILINTDNVILAGHTRLAALQKLGFEEADCIRITDLTEEEEKAFRIADNKVTEFSRWDGDLLEAEMREIGADDWELFGFKSKDLKAIMPAELCTCPKCGRQFARL